MRSKSRGRVVIYRNVKSIVSGLIRMLKAEVCGGEGAFVVHFERSYRLFQGPLEVEISTRCRVRVYAGIPRHTSYFLLLCAAGWMEKGLGFISLALDAVSLDLLLYFPHPGNPQHRSHHALGYFFWGILANPSLVMRLLNECHLSQGVASPK